MPLRSALLLSLAALLAFRGGLHAWQLALGALLLLGALLAGPAPRVSRGEALALGSALLALAVGLPGAWSPQDHVNAWALVMALGVFFVLARRMPDWSVQRGVHWVLGLGVLMSALFLAVGAVGGEAGHPDSVAGFLLRPHISARWLAPNQNLLAGAWAVPALLAALALAMEGRRWAWAAAAVAGSAILYAGSRGALLALLAGLAYLALRVGRRPRIWAGVGAVALVMLGLTAYSPLSWLAQRVRIEQAPVHEEKDPQLFRRKEFWARSFQASLEAPWLGRGLGAFPLVARRFDLPVPLSEKQPIARYRLDLLHAHNEWLTFAVELGWPATAGLLLALGALALRRWREGAASLQTAAMESALAAGLVVSMVDMNLRAPGILAAYALVAAALFPRPDLGAGRNAFLTGICGLALLMAIGLWAGRGQGPARLRLASLLQPLDVQLQLQRIQQAQPPSPWAGWAGRHRSEWLWQASADAAKQGRYDEALIISQRAVDARPYWAPGWLWLGERTADRGRLTEAERQVDHALTLEPNFSRAMAWRCDRALALGRRDEGRRWLKRIHAVLALKVRRELPDAYTLYIQSVDPAWLEKRNKELGLSTIFAPES